MFKLNYLLPRLVTTTPYPISNGFWGLDPRETQPTMFKPFASTNLCMSIASPPGRTLSQLAVSQHSILSPFLSKDLYLLQEVMSISMAGTPLSPCILLCLCSIISKPCLISPPYFPHLLFKFSLLPASSQNLNISVPDYSFLFSFCITYLPLSFLQIFCLCKHF